MDAVALVRFKDLKSGAVHEAGEVFETSPEHLAKLNESRYGKLAEAVEHQEEPKQDDQEEQKQDEEEPKQDESGAERPERRVRRKAAR